MIFCPRNLTLHVEAFQPAGIQGLISRPSYEGFLPSMNCVMAYHIQAAVQSASCFCLRRGGRRPAGHHLAAYVRFYYAGHCALRCTTGISLRKYSQERSPRPSTVSPMMTHGLLWQKIPAFSFVAGGIGGDFSILHNIAGEGWIVEYNTVFAVQAFLYGVQRFFTMPSSSPMPAMVHQPCDSMKICPSSFSLNLPCGRSNRRRASTSHRPSHVFLRLPPCCLYRFALCLFRRLYPGGGTAPRSRVRIPRTSRQSSAILPGCLPVWFPWSGRIHSGPRRSSSGSGSRSSRHGR